jgi:hypothetical protein
MARVVLTDHDVTVHLSPLDEVLSLHGSLRIPYTHVAAAAADPVPPDWYRGFKIGTNIPGLKVAGTFVTGEGAIFYDFHDGGRCLTLELRHERYRRVVVEVDRDQDHAALAAEIRARLGRGQP